MSATSRATTAATGHTFSMYRKQKCLSRYVTKARGGGGRVHPAVKELQAGHAAEAAIYQLMPSVTANQCMQPTSTNCLRTTVVLARNKTV